MIREVAAVNIGGGKVKEKPLFFKVTENGGRRWSGVLEQRINEN